MTIYDLKPAFQNLLRPICKGLANAGVTANQVTLAALLLSLACGAALALYPTARWALLLVPVWLFVRMALNAIDGMLAREHNMKSALGSLLNEIGDVVSDTAIYVAFAFVPGIDARLVILVVVLAVFTELAGVAAVQI
ncbi:MAG: CDP-alcohol phosphatidyltransferase family protein, partial [Gammaproteobacteria bacterium]|nr:CDP-alcohol phosphatidyltransferase family protein [Gammaproteobacteria bacterium]